MKINYTNAVVQWANERHGRAPSDVRRRGYINEGAHEESGLVTLLSPAADFAGIDAETTHMGVYVQFKNIEKKHYNLKVCKLIDIANIRDDVAFSLDYVDESTQTVEKIGWIWGREIHDLHAQRKTMIMIHDDIEWVYVNKHKLRKPEYFPI